MTRIRVGWKIRCRPLLCCLAAAVIWSGCLQARRDRDAQQTLDTEPHDTVTPAPDSSNSDDDPNSTTPAPPGPSLPLTSSVPAALANAQVAVVLDIKDRHSASGTPVGVFAMLGEGHQEWQIVASAGPPNAFVLRNPKRGKCLAPKDGSKDPGVTLVIAECSDSPAQKWLAEPDQEDRFLLRNVQANLCLELNGPDEDNFNRAVLQPCDVKVRTQVWSLKKQPWRVADGQVTFSLAVERSFTSISYTIEVPKRPATLGSYASVGSFLSPNVFSPSVKPFGQGWLEALVHWGKACGGDLEPRDYSEWFGYASYANYDGSPGPGLTVAKRCVQSPSLATPVGSSVAVKLTRTSQGWTQQLTNTQTKASVSLPTELGLQAQNELAFVVLSSYGTTLAPTSPTTLTNIALAIDGPNEGFCSPRTIGVDDTVQAPKVAADGLSCAIDKIVLSGLKRPQGWPVTP